MDPRNNSDDESSARADQARQYAQRAFAPIRTADLEKRYSKWSSKVKFELEQDPPPFESDSSAEDIEDDKKSNTKTANSDPGKTDNKTDSMPARDFSAIERTPSLEARLNQAILSAVGLRRLEERHRRSDDRTAKSCPHTKVPSTVKYPPGLTNIRSVQDFFNEWDEESIMGTLTDDDVVDKWQLIWDILGSDPNMMKGGEQFGNFMKMLVDCVKLSRPVGFTGPICGNPACREFGHTLAVCPKPTNMEHGDMLGCFFCNTVDHDADDCAMMNTVTPEVLVTHLITNRCGMPPWATRVDWVKLAIKNWDVVNFNCLPLTRDYVKKMYIPQKGWDLYYSGGLSVDPTTNEPNNILFPNSGTNSPTGPPAPFFVDPLFAKNTGVQLLKKLSKPLSAEELKLPERKRRKPLMEAATHLCYCEASEGIFDPSVLDKSDHFVFRNKTLRRYIPDMRAKKEDMEALETVRLSERQRLERELGIVPKKQPKIVDPEEKKKKKKGRRAMKKEREAELQREKEKKEIDEIVEAAKKGTTATISTTDGDSEEKYGWEQGRWMDPDEDTEPLLSDRMLDLTDQVCGVFDKLKGIVKDCNEEIAAIKAKHAEERAREAQEVQESQEGPDGLKPAQEGKAAPNMKGQATTSKKKK